MKAFRPFALILALCPIPAFCQTCPAGFASSGSCGVSLIGGGGQPFALVGTQNGFNPSLSGSKVLLAQTSADHTALSLNFQTKVNVQAFTIAFKFVPNGQNLSLVFNNSNNNPYFNGAAFSAGAGCEAGFFQAFSQPSPPNNVFALELDSYSPLVLGGPFAGSSVQTYVSGISPCLPNDSGNTYPTTSKISTSPVNMTTGLANTTTGDTYSATVTYDESNLTLNLYDVNAGGSCPGASCFAHTWTGVDIPTAVGSDTAWVGITEGTGTVVPPSPLYIDSFTYSAGTPPSGLPSVLAMTGRHRQVATPTATPGTYIAGSGALTPSGIFSCGVATGVSVPVGALVFYAEIDAGSPSDGFNTYTALPGATEGANLFYTINTHAGVLSIGSSGGELESCATASYSGVSPDSPLDGTPAVNNAPTMPTSVGPVVTSNATDLLITAFAGQGALIEPYVIPGFTLDYYPNGQYAWFSQNVSSAGSNTASWTGVTGVSPAATIYLAAFKRSTP